jgi:hypothetical protein
MYFKDFASGRHDREHRAPGQEAGHQAGHRRRERGHPHRRPARVDPAGVQGARGPAQHHQPRRLGEDLGQEGRAHRLRPHPRQHPTTRARGPAGARSSGSPPGSTSSRAADPGRVAMASRRSAASRPSTASSSAGWPSQPDRRVLAADQRLRVERRPRGDRPRVGWDFEDERPATTPGASPSGRARPRGRDPPGQRGAHQRGPLLRRPRPPRDLHPRVRRPRSRSVVFDRAAEEIVQRRWRRPPRCCPTGQEIVVYKNNSDGKGNSYGCHENYLMDREVPFGRIVAASCRTSSPARCSPAPARSAARRPASHRGAVPAQPAGRLLRGGGRPRDHAQAPDRQHPRRAPRRRPEVPAPARDRRRRQPEPRSPPSSRSAPPRSCWR